MTRVTDRSKQGSGLIITMIFIVLAGVVSAALLSASVDQRRLAHHQTIRERAFNLAEAAIEHAAQQIAASNGVLATPVTATGTHQGYPYAYRIESAGGGRYAIYATGTVLGVRRSITVARAELPAWSRYAMWMDQNGNNYFVGGEEYYGHVHANDKLLFSTVGGVGPIFHDRATSATNSFGGTTNETVFAKGLQLNCSQGKLDSVTFADLKASATAFGLVLEGQTDIRLTGTTMRVTNTRIGWSDQSVTIGTNMLLYVQDSAIGNPTTMPGRVSICGTIDGRMTIVAERDIDIVGHIRCEADPRFVTSDDMLGLVAKDDVWVKPSAPDNLDVFAAMIAAGQLASNDGSFGVINYDSGSPRGALTVWGSIVQEVRGNVGTFDAFGPVTGYYKNYGYDNRNLTDPPPFYPRVSGKVVLTGWSEGPG